MTATTSEQQLTRDTAWTGSYQHLTRFEVLHQSPYAGQNTPFEPRAPVCFLDNDGNPTLLHTMLDKDFKKAGWDQPWTTLDTTDEAAIGQKMSFRVRLPDCSIDKQETICRFAQKREAITKAKLGHRVARGLEEKLKEYCRRNNLDFKDIAIYELQNVSLGSWQPVLGIRVPVA